MQSGNAYHWRAATEMKPSPAEAATVALYRRGVRADFTQWVKHCGFEPAQHHRLIIEKLTAVAEGRIKNLILLMPPGSGKSIYASVWFVCWFLARYPTKSIISASHTVELAESWGTQGAQSDFGAPRHARHRHL